MGNNNLAGAESKFGLPNSAIEQSPSTTRADPSSPGLSKELATHVRIRPQPALQQVTTYRRRFTNHGRSIGQAYQASSLALPSNEVNKK